MIQIRDFYVPVSLWCEDEEGGVGGDGWILRSLPFFSLTPRPLWREGYPALPLGPLLLVGCYTYLLVFFSPSLLY